MFVYKGFVVWIGVAGVLPIATLSNRMTTKLDDGTDLNTVTGNGSYYIRLAGDNSPDDYFFFNVFQSNKTSDLVQYGFVMTTTIRLYIRFYFNGNWLAWKSITLS